MAVIDGDVAPPDRALPFGRDRLLDQLLEKHAAFGVGRQIAHPDAVPAGWRQLDAGCRPTEKRIWNLKQDPRAVTRVGVGALSAPVLEVLERESAFSTTA